MLKRLSLSAVLMILAVTLTLNARGQQGNQNVAHPAKSGGDQSAVEASSRGKHQQPASKDAAAQKYDPSRNAEQDLKAAMAEARRTGKRILLKVGGEWCIWCHIMDAFFDKHAELSALSAKNFVTLKINFSEENPNAALLSKYPAISGYPHIFVLDRDGKLLRSQDTGELEEGKSYNLQKLMTFLTQWAPSAVNGGDR